VPFPRYHHSYSGRLSFSAKTSVFSENFYTTVKVRYNQTFKPFVKYLNLGLKRCNLAVDGSATEQLSYMAGHVANPATKFEDPTTIRP